MQTQVMVRPVVVDATGSVMADGGSPHRRQLPLMLAATLFKRFAPPAHVLDLASDLLLQLQPFIGVGGHRLECSFLLGDLRQLAVNLSMRPL